MLYKDQPSETPIVVRLTEPGEDVEMKAMAYIWSILAELNQTQRDRVVQYISARNDAAKNELRINS